MQQKEKMTLFPINHLLSEIFILSSVYPNDVPGNRVLLLFPTGTKRAKESKKAVICSCQDSA